MTPEPPSCPYCNAFVPVASGAGVGQRVPCPRCGEVFALRPSPAGSGLQPTAAAPTATDAPPRTGRRNRAVAGVVVGGMAVAAALSLAYALYTQPDRRDHDMPPMQEALRWLPPDTTVVAGVHVADLGRTQAGRDLLNHLLQVGKVDVNADMLQRWTGLRREEIDIVALGVRADDGLVPCTVLVVRTLRPYDAGAVKTALGAEPAADAAGKALFRCKPQEAGLRPVVWFADARTLVLGLLEKHLDAVPDRPAANLDALPAAVQEVLNQRVDVGAPAWVVGYSRDWRNTAAALVLGALPEKDADLLARVRSFAVQTDVEPPGLTVVALKCDDDAAAQALETRLAAAKPAAADWKADRQGLWLTLELRGDAMKLLKALEK